MLNRLKSLIGLERRSTNPNDPWAGFAALRSTSVNADSAQGVAAVYAAVACIAEAVGSLPLHLYKRGDDDSVKATEHPLYAVLHHGPNDQQSAVEFREWMTSCMLLRGNAFARIVRGWDGQVRALEPLPPERVNIVTQGDKIAGYEYTDKDGKRETLLPAEVFHLRHRAGNDPLIGLSPIQAAKGVIELALSEQEHGRNTFNNGAKLLGLLKFPGVLKPEQRQAIGASWASQYTGGGNAGKTAILDGGAEFQSLTMNMEDAEWIAARRFSVEEVARIFKIPPPLIGDLSSSNYSNSTEMARWFVVHTLRRHLAAWEGAIARQLLTEAGRRIYYAEHSAEGMLRGDSTTRASFYASGIASGWMLPSEARRLENLPSIEGIDDRPIDGNVRTQPVQPYPSKQREAQP